MAREGQAHKARKKRASPPAGSSLGKGRGYRTRGVAWLVGRAQGLPFCGPPFFSLDWELYFTSARVRIFPSPAAPSHCGWMNVAFFLPSREWAVSTSWSRHTHSCCGGYFEIYPPASPPVKCRVYLCGESACVSATLAPPPPLPESSRFLWLEVNNCLAWDNNVSLDRYSGNDLTDFGGMKTTTAKQLLPHGLWEAFLPCLLVMQPASLQELQWSSIFYTLPSGTSRLHLTLFEEGSHAGETSIEGWPNDNTVHAARLLIEWRVSGYLGRL